MHGLKPLLALVITALPAPAIAQERSIDPPIRGDNNEGRDAPSWHLYLSSGLNYSQRDEQREPRTDYYRIPLLALLSNGRLRVSVSMPYLIVKGPAGVVGDDDDVDGETPSGAIDETRKGFGDLSITGRYGIPADHLGGFELDLLGRVKFPTASRAKRLGTGTTDFAIGAEVTREMKRLAPFVSAQYRFNGDSRERDYRNTVATSVGTAVRLSRRSRATLAWDYSQSRIAGRGGLHMLDAGLSTRLKNGLRFSGNAALGLSKNAPDFRLGAALTARVF